MTVSWPDYELLDFGGGRKLERFGPWVLDRPCPSATLAVSSAKTQAWRDATARYEGDRAADGVWSPTINRWKVDSCSFAVGDDLGVTLNQYRIHLDQAA